MSEKNFNAERKLKAVLKRWKYHEAVCKDLNTEWAEAKSDAYGRCIGDVQSILNDRKKWVAKCLKKSSK